MAWTIWFSNWNFRFSRVNGKYPWFIGQHIFIYYKYKSFLNTFKHLVWAFGFQLICHKYAKFPPPSPCWLDIDRCIILTATDEWDIGVFSSVVEMFHNMQHFGGLSFLKFARTDNANQTLLVLNNILVSLFFCMFMDLNSVLIHKHRLK